ncbi:MAG: hypothetical protein WCU88_03885 [Elusimicrobiota bacterium]
MNPLPLFLLTAVLSFCSIVYELLLAQSMSATLGDSFLRYNVTIGLYLASLGLGAMLCSRRRKADLIVLLADVEIALTVLGALGPLLILLWDAAAFKAGTCALLRGQEWIRRALVLGFDHGIIILIGLLSGFELPLLMRLGKESASDLSSEVLAVDYFGTLLGALAFPLLLLPGVGVLSAAALTALLNALCALYLLTFLRTDARRLCLCCASSALCIAMLVCREPLQRAALSWYLQR